MRKNNALGKTEYLCEHLFWGLVTWFLYKNTLFRCIDGYSFTESRYILLGCVGICCLIGILFERDWNRNELGTTMHLVMGFGIYTAWAYIQIRRSWILLILSAAAILTVSFMVLILCRRIRGKTRAGQIFRRRLMRGIFVGQNIMGTAMIVVMATFGVNVFLGTSVMNAEVDPAVKENLDTLTASDHMETLALLQEDSWESLTVQERLNVLQVAANIEQRYLGLPNELNVGAGNLEENVHGCYLDQTHEILVDMDSLLEDPSWDVLETVCHEAYHSYEHRMIEAVKDVDENSKNLKLFRKAEIYAEEFGNYATGEDDFCHYFEQKCESDARDYAREALEEYRSKIATYLEKGEEKE